MMQSGNLLNLAFIKSRAGLITLMIKLLKSISNSLMDGVQHNMNIIAKVE